MSYNPTQWSAGDTVTSAKLNKIEQGISDNGVLEINVIFDEEMENARLDKTWQEIYNANNSVIIIPSDSEEYPTRTKVINVGFNTNEDWFEVIFFVGSQVPSVFSATTPNDYPLRTTSSDPQPIV